MRVLIEAYGFEVRAHVALNGAEKPLAGIPFCRIADIMVGTGSYLQTSLLVGFL